MSEEKLYNRLLFDLRRLKLPYADVDICIRPFSKTYYGRYFPVYNDCEIKPRIFIYPYEKNGKFMSYDDVLRYLIHEFCHHLQYTDIGFERLKGVMHDTNFWKLYNYYVNRAIKKGIISNVKEKVV